MQDRLAQVRTLLVYISHPVIATTNEDQSPHNTPVFGVFNSQLELFWSSAPGSIHSRNIARDPRVFIVLFDSRQGRAGLYITARAKRLQDKPASERAYQLLAESKTRLGAPMADWQSYEAQGTQQIYQATPERCWINYSIKDAHGAIIDDQRQEIPLSQLTQEVV